MKTAPNLDGWLQERPSLQPFGLRFEDPALEEAFNTAIAPVRRRVGQANAAVIPVCAAIIWLAIELGDGPFEPVQRLFLALDFGLGVAFAAWYRWGPTRWFDVANLAIFPVFGALIVGFSLWVDDPIGDAIALAAFTIFTVMGQIIGTASYPYLLAATVLSQTLFLGALITQRDYPPSVTAGATVILGIALLLGAQRGRLIARLVRESFYHQRRSEQVLASALPASIVERLKHGEGSIADGYPSATVLFADLVGFTHLAARLPPHELVAILRQIFDRFDALTEAAGVEKIKTIGDAYMVAGGIADGRSDHVLRLARLALDMRDAFARLDAVREHGLALRIGLNAGPVVAGVLGTTRIAYDLWGDVVNTAARMESHGEPGRIHVTEGVANALAEQPEFAVSLRGPVTVQRRDGVRA